MVVQHLCIEATLDCGSIKTMKFTLLTFMGVEEIFCDKKRL